MIDDEAPLLPNFVVEPDDQFVVRGSPAKLQCYVASASKALFKCNGKWVSAGESEIFYSTDDVGQQ